MASPTSSPVRGIYWPLSATNFQPSARETNYITHIYCAFFVPSNVTFKIEVDDLTAPKLTNSTSTLRSMEPNVKILFSVSGDNADPLLFSQMVSSQWSRRNFIDSSIEVARKFDFDGIDLHWQFPENQSDMDNLGTLLREWRDAVRKDAEKSKKPPLLLSAATYFSVDLSLLGVHRKYPVCSLSENLDWINVMCYDYHYWSKDTPVTGAPAALYDPTRNNNCTSYGLESWIQAGFPPDKLIMGLPLFGRTWTLYDKSSHGIGAPAVGMGPGTKGYLTYPEVVQFNRENHAHVVQDDTMYVTAYSFSGICWVGYDDSNSITKKIQYARPQGLGGYFFWEFNGDDDCDLIRAAYEAWPSTPAN